MKAVESIAIFLLLVFFGACLENDLISGDLNEELNTSEKSYANVDRELWPYFHAFEKAAISRGFTIDLSKTNIFGTIEDIDNQNVAGTCSYGGRSNYKDVIIDKTFWNQARNLNREYIVFHELGHCYLFRDHHEACFVNNTYVSMMRSGTGFCRDNYSSQTRDYYLDELLTPLYGP